MDDNKEAIKYINKIKSKDHKWSEEIKTGDKSKKTGAEESDREGSILGEVTIFKFPEALKHITCLA